MAHKDAAETFFSQALLETRSAPPLEQAGFMPLPERYKRALYDHVAKNFASSLTFKSLSSAGKSAAKSDKFTDSTFPPTKDSLIKFWDLADIQAQNEWGKFTWARISDVFSELQVFNKIDPGDIRQGVLGDCYFLSAISALAENPGRIKRLFLTSSPAPNCQYRITLMDLGQWREYVVDDFFPMKDSDEFAFSSPFMEDDCCEMWVLLLEKVWAKKYGSYYDIEKGFADEVFTDLTGAPCVILERSDPNLWEKLVQADTRNHIITAGCVGRTGDEDSELALKGLGLVKDHSYAVIKVKEVNTSRGKVRLLQIRNPWHRFEWEGDWSDSSAKWTPAIKHEVGFSDEEDGVFWMSLTDFLTFFETCTICMAEDSYWTFSLAMDQRPEEEFSVVEVRITQETDLYFIVCQVDERRFGGIEGGYSYSPVRLMAAKQVYTSAHEYITGKIVSGTRDAWLHLPGLTPGCYLIYVEFQWKNPGTDLFGVSVYCSQELELKDVTASNGDFITKCFADPFLPKFSPKPILSTPDFHYSLISLSSSDGSQPNLYCDIYENKSPSSSFALTVTHQPWVNMSIVGQGDSGHWETVIRPGEKKVIVKKQKAMEAKHAFKVNVKKNLAGDGGKTT